MEETARLTESIKELLAGGRDERLAAVLGDAHAADISQTLRELPLADQVRLFRMLDPQQAGAVLAEVDDQVLLELVRALDETEVSKILEQIPSDDVVEVVEELPKEQADKILDLMEDEKSEEVQELLEYGEGTAGRLMSPRFVAVNEHAPSRSDRAHPQVASVEDAFYYLYVVDDHEHLVGRGARPGS